MILNGRTFRKREKGFTLLEVLIALIIISIGLLGLAALQASGLKFNHDAYVRTQTTNLAYDIIERMRIDRTKALSNSYSGTYAAANATDTCTHSSVSVSDATMCWQVEIRDNMPGGGSAVISNAGGTNSNEFTITISWQNRSQGGSTQTWAIAL